MKTFFEYLENGNRVVLRESFEKNYNSLLNMIEENEYSDDSFLIFADWLESVGRAYDARFIRFIIEHNAIDHPRGKVLRMFGLRRIKRELGNSSIEEYNKSHINHNFFNVARNHKFNFKNIPFQDLFECLVHAGRNDISFEVAEFLVTWRVMKPEDLAMVMMHVEGLRQRSQLLSLIIEEYPHLSSQVIHGLRILSGVYVR
jgi:uncharacterized protein (TIGR02996 family)